MQVVWEVAIRMSRPWLLVFLLLLIVFTSQFEWKQQFGNENDLTPNKSQKEQYVSEREETVKEKVRTLLMLLLCLYVLHSPISNQRMIFSTSFAIIYHKNLLCLDFG